MSAHRWVWKRLYPGHYLGKLGTTDVTMTIRKVRPRTFTATKADGSKIKRKLGRWQITTDSGAGVGFGTDTFAEARQKAEAFYCS